MTKREIIEKMIENGYDLMGRTIEWYEENFDEETLMTFLNHFLEEEENKLYISMRKMRELSKNS